MIFDSHFHLNHPDFLGEEETVWNAAREAGIREGMIIGYDLESSRRAIDLVNRFPGLYASVGVSPHDILAAPSDHIEQLQVLSTHPKVVAIGECGLEYHYPAGPKDVQIHHFLLQSQLAHQLGKTLVIHLREADDDFLHILDSSPPTSAILHCFTATPRVMERSIRQGYFISFSGILTFKNAKDLHALLPQVPDRNLLVETDAPYLAPIPYRGKRCEPKMIVETVRKIADLRGTDEKTIARLTLENARRAFGISE